MPLEKECELLRKQLKEAEGLLEYERSLFQVLLRNKEEGICKQLSEEIGLELLAIRETAEYVDEPNKRRILRRLQQIDDILNRFFSDGEENDIAIANP